MYQSFGQQRLRFYLKKYFFIEVELIYNVVPISAVQQSDLVIHIKILWLIIEYGDVCRRVGKNTVS